ncbi:MAG: hypothetical protein WBG75_20400, partial [Mycolicibacter algericus]
VPAAAWLPATAAAPGVPPAWLPAACGVAAAPAGTGTAASAAAAAGHRNAALTAFYSLRSRSRLME